MIHLTPEKLPYNCHTFDRPCSVQQLQNSLNKYKIALFFDISSFPKLCQSAKHVILINYNCEVCEFYLIHKLNIYYIEWV